MTLARARKSLTSFPVPVAVLKAVGAKSPFCIVGKLGRGERAGDNGISSGRKKGESDHACLKKFKCPGGCFGDVDRRISLQSQLRNVLVSSSSETRLRVLP